MMKTLLESIFDDDDIIRDVENAPNEILNEMGVDKFVSFKNNKYHINTRVVTYIKYSINEITKNADKLRPFSGEIADVHSFSFSMNNDLFKYFKINKCRYLNIHEVSSPNLNIDKIDVIRVTDFDLELQDDYLRMVCELANKHKTYAVYFDAFPDYMTIQFINSALNALKKCKTVKYILFAYTSNMVDFAKLGTNDVNQAPELIRELDTIYADGENRNIYFVSNFNSGVSKSITARRFEPHNGSYIVKYLRLDATKDLKKQLK